MRFVIIGNGIAGVSAATGIRRLRKKALITVISEEPHPTYSACILPNYISGETKRRHVFIKNRRDYQKEDIQFLPAYKVTAIDTECKKVVFDSDSIPYDRLIIATGSKAAVPHFNGVRRKGVYTLKSLRDADQIYHWNGQTVVVIGSGPIGVEVSLALKKRGYRVSIVELIDRVLPRIFDDFPASIAQKLLEAGGIEVLTGEKVVEIAGSKHVEAVITDRGRIECDTVILSAGVRPEVRLAEEKLVLGELGGILVDDRMNTSVANIFACGDCAETKDLVSGCSAPSLLWHNARRQGVVAASNAVGIPCGYPGSLQLTGIEIFNIQAVSIGETAGSSMDGLEVIEREADNRYQRLVLSCGVLVGVQSINWDENIGGLLSTILRREKVRNPSELFVRSMPLNKPPEYCIYDMKSV